MRCFHSALVFVFTAISVMYSREIDLDLENSSTLYNQFNEYCCNDAFVNFEEKEAYIEKADFTTSLHPNPTVIGKNVTINNIEIGDEISIFQQSGKFIVSQTIDIDKQIYTGNLTSGEYVIRTQTQYLKLIVD